MGLDRNHVFIFNSGIQERKIDPDFYLYIQNVKKVRQGID